MSQNSEELHSASVLRIRILMKCLGMLPIKNFLVSKVLCHLVLLTFVIYLIYWRFGLEYEIVYLKFFDDFSKFFDVSHYATLITCHVVVVLELIWKNGSQEIKKHFEGILIYLNQFLCHLVNLNRIRKYCNIVYILWLLCFVTYIIITGFDNLELSYYIMYSNTVITLRLTEFSLYCCVILALHHDLNEVASNIVNELQQTRFEALSIRRLSLEKLRQFQKVHGLLWASIRSVETTFQLSLFTIICRTFVHCFAMPYWLYFNIIWQNRTANILYCATDECIKLLEIMVPCWICTRCDVLQRRFRSLFYTVTTDRRNRQLNAALNRLCMQLGQEKCRFSAAGLVEVSTEMLGKFIFGMVSYIVICIQFSMNLMAKKLKKHAENFTTIEPK